MTSNKAGNHSSESVATSSAVADQPVPKAPRFVERLEMELDIRVPSSFSKVWFHRFQKADNIRLS